MTRQARLYEEYATWYPGIPPDRWQLAESVRRIVLRQLRHGAPSWAPGPRILSDPHFEFQGESAAGPPQACDVERRRRAPRVTPRQAPATGSSHPELRIAPSLRRVWPSGMKVTLSASASERGWLIRPGRFHARAGGTRAQR
jgi:hypothetical protein